VVKEAYAKAGLYKPGVIDFDTRDLTPAEFTERLAKQPLVGHPGQMWQYSLATDLLGRVVEAAAGQTLSAFLAQRVFQPLGMPDTAFHVPAEKMARLAQPFARPTSGPFVSPQIDVSRPPGNDSGGAGAVGTAIDYLRFAQAMLNGGSLDGQRIVSRPTAALMMSDHVGDRPSVPAGPPELLLGTQGYGFGLGFLVRSGTGLAGVPGNAGEAMWAGYGGTYFWIDPKEQLVAVLMSQGPAASRAYYRRMVKALVYQAIED
jgi:CubicO group peptidase (beta-lactamase class C family)